MIRNFNSIKGLSILQHDNGELLGILQHPIIDTETGKIEAFWIKPATIPLAHAILQTQDILEWKKNIYVKNDSVISDPVDVIKISEILSRNILVIGNATKNELDNDLGIVYDIDFNTEKLYLNNIYVQKSFLGIIKFNQRIYNFNSIIEIFPQYILIKDDSAEKDKVVVSKLREEPSV